MQLASLSKTARTIGLMFLLSATIGTSMQQSAQAQAPNAVNPALKVKCVPQAEGEFIFAFKDINPSPKLVKAYDRVSAALSRRTTELDKDVRKELVPDSPVDWAVKGEGISNELGTEISNALDALARDRVPPAEMIKLLTKKYGQYVEFFQENRSFFTPEQLAVWDRVQREHLDEVASIFPPAQQKIFRANILRVSQFDACQPPPRTLDPAYRNKTIVDIAASSPKFSTLVQALKAAGLTETLSGKTPLTVFAPTNEAFAALPKGTLEKLLKPENRDTLRKVLTYHVVPGAVESQILRSGTVNSIAGSPINVQVPQTQLLQKQIKVNNATVILEDVKVSNGVIHVIDKVLLPPGL